MLLWPFPSLQPCFMPHSQRACVCLCKTIPINKLSFLIYFIYCQSALECLDLHCHRPHCRVCVMARCLSVRPSVCSACITTPSMVRHDICRHSYPVERGLVVSLCGQPHCCYRPYYPTARFRSPSSYMVFNEPFPDRSRPMSC